jgi:hypothetical protein
MRIKKTLWPIACFAAVLATGTGNISNAATIRVIVENLSSSSTPVTPVFAAFHDGSYDIARAGGTATAGLEQLAEVGMNATIASEFGTADGRVSGNLGGGPITPGSTASADFTIDSTGTSNLYLSLGSMVLPSSDYIFGTVSDPGDTQFGINLATLFATGTQTFTLDEVYDVGTEVNDFETSAPPIPAASGLFAGGPFDGVLPNSNPPSGIDQSGTIALVGTPFAGFANTPFAAGAEPNVDGLRFTLTNISAVPEPSSGLAMCFILGTAVMRRRRRR